jgi:hypothetical protein
MRIANAARTTGTGLLQHSTPEIRLGSKVRQLSKQTFLGPVVSCEHSPEPLGRVRHPPYERR